MQFGILPMHLNAASGNPSVAHVLYSAAPSSASATTKVLPTSPTAYYLPSIIPHLLPPFLGGIYTSALLLRDGLSAHCQVPSASAGRRHQCTSLRRLQQHSTHRGRTQRTNRAHRVLTQGRRRCFPSEQGIASTMLLSILKNPTRAVPSRVVPLYSPTWSARRLARP